MTVLYDWTRQQDAKRQIARGKQENEKQVWPWFGNNANEYSRHQHQEKIIADKTFQIEITIHQVQYRQCAQRPYKNS